MDLYQSYFDISKIPTTTGVVMPPERTLPTVANMAASPYRPNRKSPAVDLYIRVLANVLTAAHVREVGTGTFTHDETIAHDERFQMVHGGNVSADARLLTDQTRGWLYHLLR